MFKNRSVNVKLQKDEKTPATKTTTDTRSIEEKTGAILKPLGKFGFKVALCVGAYVLLDTFRQVSVARATIDYDQEED